MTPSKYDEYMARALLAEYVPMYLFADMNPDNELIPGRDGLEESND